MLVLRSEDPARFFLLNDFRNQFFLEAPIILIIPLLITNYSLSYPQQVCQFFVVVWFTFYVLNCPNGVQALKSRTMS